MSETFDRLKAELAEVDYLSQAVALLGWDRETYMPTGGAEDRANQLALLQRLKHLRFTSDELGRLLEELATEVRDLDPDSDEARIVAVTRRDYDRLRRIPPKLVEDISRATSVAITAWREARAKKDYSIFAPALKRNAELNLQLAEATGYQDRPYDALLRINEPDRTTTHLEKIFAELREAIVPLMSDIAAHRDAVDDSCLHREFDKETQLRFSMGIARQIGYDTNRGRLDLSAHPFTTSFGWGDIRITTRIWHDFLNVALFSTIHEAGHAMYEQGVSPTLRGTLLSHGTSAGVHESQSRLWENLVGRSRAFQEYLFPHLKAAYPEQLRDVDVEGFYRAVNVVKPSLNRVESDEVTYNLHIILRFELENDMLAGKVDIDRLDEIWNERMDYYLGVTAPDSVQGVLQDIHWTEADSFGVFPGYTLGNIIGAQLFAQAHMEMPDLDEQISRGDMSALLGWLTEKLYRHGRKFEPNAIVQRITGKPIGTEDWISYVRGKYSDIYGL